MTREFLQMAYLFLPLLGGALFHGLCVRYHWLAFLARPLDYRATVRGQRLFGDHKTLRGVLAIGIGSMFVMAVQANVLHNIPSISTLETFDYGTINSWFFGFGVGVAAMLSELPNSFVKRQFKIRPGAQAHGAWVTVFYPLDQIDLLVGAWLVFSLVMEVTFERVIISAIVIFFVHQIISIFGYFFGMRSTFN